MGHVELGKVRFEGDPCPIHTLQAKCNLWFGLLSHVFRENLKKKKDSRKASSCSV